MNETIYQIREVERLMAPSLDGGQMKRLHAVLDHCLLSEGDFPYAGSERSDNDALLSAFIAAKRLEGCSERSLSYYTSVLTRFIEESSKPLYEITTEDIRAYLTNYQKTSGSSNVTADNIRRVVSSLFSWLEAEDFIYKSPVRRIRKIKSPKSVKPILTDESLESMRDACMAVRDLAIIDMLCSTGIRVGELVRLDKKDIDFEGRECIVHGKGSKERRVYFDARTKVHLERYLASRADDNPALFVSLNAPHGRLQISGVETRLRKMGQRLELPRVYPHKFRRTLATKAIDKGMPIEQVQVLLGHSKIDTTLCYAMVDDNNVKQSHRRFIG